MPMFGAPTAGAGGKAERQSEREKEGKNLGEGDATPLWRKTEQNKLGFISHQPSAQSPVTLRPPHAEASVNLENLESQKIIPVACFCDRMYSTTSHIKWQTALTSLLLAGSFSSCFFF